MTPPPQKFVDEAWKCFDYHEYWRGATGWKEKSIEKIALALQTAVREENAACAAIAKVGIGKEPLSEASEEAQVIFDAIIARQTHQKQVSG